MRRAGALEPRWVEPCGGWEVPLRRLVPGRLRLDVPCPPFLPVLPCARAGGGPADDAGCTERAGPLATRSSRARRTDDGSPLLGVTARLSTATGTPSSSTQTARSRGPFLSTSWSWPPSSGPWPTRVASSSMVPSAAPSGTWTCTSTPHGAALCSQQPQVGRQCRSSPVTSSWGRRSRPRRRSTKASSRRLPAVRSSSLPQGAEAASILARQAAAFLGLSPSTCRSVRPSSRRRALTSPSASAARLRAAAPGGSTVRTQRASHSRIRAGDGSPVEWRRASSWSQTGERW